MDPTIPDFVPGQLSHFQPPTTEAVGYRGRKSSSSANDDANGNDQELSHVRSISAHPASSHAFPSSASQQHISGSAKTAHHAASGSVEGSHARSHSVPGLPHSGGSRNTGLPSSRGSSSTRGKSSTRGRGRGGAHSSIPVQTQPVPAKPVSPPVSLDSVTDFPALGGGPGSGATLSTTHAHPKLSPHLSSGDGSEVQEAHADLSESTHHQPAQSQIPRSKSLSFARVVAPTPPADPPAPTASQPSSTTHLPTSTSMSFANAAASARSVSAASSTSTSSSSKQVGSAASSEKQTSSPPSSASPEPTESASSQSQGQSISQAQGSRKKKGSKQSAHPPLHQPDAGAHPSHQSHQPPHMSQQPFEYPSLEQVQQGGSALTPVQQAFLVANGLSVEGMPNVVSVEDLPNYHVQLQPHTEPPRPPVAAKPGKGQKKASRREQERQMQEYNAYWNQYYAHQGQPQQQIGQPFPQDSANGFQAHRPGNGPQTQASEMTRSHSGSSFHLSPAAPTFTPSFGSSHNLHATAQEFHPKHELEAAEPSERALPVVPEGQEASSDPSPAEPNDADQIGLSGEDAVTATPAQPEPVPEETPRAAVEALPVVYKEEQAPSVDPESASEPSTTDPVTEETQATEGTPAAEPSQANGSTTLSTPDFESIVQEAATPASEPSLQTELAEEVDDSVAKKNTSPEQSSAPEQKASEETKSGIWPEQYAGEGAFKETVSPGNAQVDDASDAASKTEGGGDLNGSSNDAEFEKAEQPSSPPHSTFSLLPPTTVEEVLEAAKSFVGMNGSKDDDETQEKAEKLVEEPAEAVEAVQESHQPETANQMDTQEEVKANIDELDLEKLDDEPSEEQETQPALEVTEPAEQETGEEAQDQLPQPSHSQESSGSQISDSLGPSDISQHSVSPSEVETALLSPANADTSAEALDVEIARAAAAVPEKGPSEPASTESALPSDEPVSEGVMAGSQTTSDSSKGDGPPFEIVSSSDEQCLLEDGSTPPDGSNQAPSDASPRKTQQAAEATAVPEETLESQDVSLSLNAHSRENANGLTSSDQSSITQGQQEEPEFVVAMPPADSAETLDVNRSDRSAAPSPQPAPAELPSLSIVTPSPSSSQPPTADDREASSEPSSASTSQGKRYEPPPRLHRLPSQAEKEEAIRLVAELRSEPSTPAPEDSEAFEASTVGIPSGSVTPNHHFSFNVQEKLGQLSAKRKREKKEEQRTNDEDGDAPEESDEGEKKPTQGEAPSLTLSIFSGSIMHRSQLVKSVLASMGINLFLPFLNGVMLGFGEIFARDWLGPFFGFTSVGRTGNNDSSSNQNSRFSTAGLGLRSAGNKRGGAQDVPGHAAAKTAVEALAEGAIESAT